MIPMKLDDLQRDVEEGGEHTPENEAEQVDLIKIKLDYLTSDAKLVFAPRKIKLLQIEDHFLKTSSHFPHGSHGNCRVVEEGLSSFGRLELACCPWSVSPVGFH